MIPFPASCHGRLTSINGPRRIINMAIKYPKFRCTAVIPANAGIQGIRQAIDFPINRNLRPARSLSRCSVAGLRYGRNDIFNCRVNNLEKKPI